MREASLKTMFRPCKLASKAENDRKFYFCTPCIFYWNIKPGSTHKEKFLYALRVERAYFWTQSISASHLPMITSRLPHGRFSVPCPAWKERRTNIYLHKINKYSKASESKEITNWIETVFNVMFFISLKQTQEDWREEKRMNN